MFLNILKVQDSSQQKIICPKLCPNLETLPHSCSHTDVYRHVEDTKIWGGVFSNKWHNSVSIVLSLLFLLKNTFWRFFRSAYANLPNFFFLNGRTHEDWFQFGIITNIASINIFGFLNAMSQ